MPRVNHDANHARLIAKYGVPVVTPRPKPLPASPKRVKVPDAKRETHWLKVHREYLRWRKTDDFVQWRNRQFAKQNALCYYCETPLRGTRTNVEHIIPKSKGGTNNKNNLVLACWRCNKEKNVKILSKKRRKELAKSHASKSQAFYAEMQFARELRERL